MNGWSVTGRILLSAIQSVVIIACSWYAVFVWYTDISPNRQVETTFRKTQCHIVKSALTVRQGFFNFIRLYRADFIVSYQALGPTWQSETSGSGVGRNFSTDRKGPQRLIEQMSEGSNHDCWFNPVAPQIVVLVPRHHLFSGFRLFLPMMIAIIMTYGLARNLLTGARILRYARLSAKKGRISP